MIIPLGPGSLRDSSSLPEGQSATLFQAQHIRAGPALPSYLALLHAGFSVPRMLPPGRWALTPPFHPCQMRLTERGRPLVLPQACRRGTSITGGFIFCGTFRSRVPWRKLSLAISNRDQPPGVTRRVALLWPTLASSPQLESGLSSRPPTLRSRTGDHPTHPPVTLYAAHTGATIAGVSIHVVYLENCEENRSRPKQSVWRRCCSSGHNFSRAVTGEESMRLQPLREDFSASRRHSEGVSATSSV
jgi:hypothetical protein